MMATVQPASSSLTPLLESLEDPSVSQTEYIDAYLTIANRLSGEEGQQFIVAVGTHFSRLCTAFKGHIASSNAELSQAALQALGFSVFHSSIASGLTENYVEELLTSLSSIAVKSSDKNTCTRALWVMAKQNFPPEFVGKKVPDVLTALETVHSREDVQSVVMEHEALNVVIRLLEQTPSQMGEGAVRWAKLIIPLVVHSAPKVRLRAAAALELGMPLLVEKQQEVAAITEPLMSSKLIPELQKLFSTKNETNVLKLWPLFVRLLGKSLHRGGTFINSLLHLEELGFRSSSPVVKKIAFIAWKSLIDNFALNPEILCSTKRLKLLMQPLSSIQVRTEALLLTKLEVWWYLAVKLGPHFGANFEQVGIPLIQSTLSAGSPTTPTSGNARGSPNQTIGASPASSKAGSFGSPTASRLNLNSSVQGAGLPAYPSIQLLGVEMLLHFFYGPDVSTAVAQNKLHLSLEPLTHPLISSTSFFCKHAGVLINAVQEGFTAVGKEASNSMLLLIWKKMISCVMLAIETGNKKERQGSEVLTLLLQALKHIVTLEALPPPKVLCLLEATVKGIPPKVLGSPAYQGTPALFLIILFFQGGLLESFVMDERFYTCMETLVGSGLCGPTSPLAFSESVLSVINQNATLVTNKEHLWRMWSIIVNPLKESITQTNEVNQGDALEYNFTAIYSALMLPITHLVTVKGFPQATMKTLLKTWSEFYKTFARCSALVATAEENICCEELCAKIMQGLENNDLLNSLTLEAFVNILLVMIECINFSPYTPKFQQKNKSPHTPSSWKRKKNKPLGNLTSFMKILALAMNSFHKVGISDTAVDSSVPSVASAGMTLLSILSALFCNLSLAQPIQEALSSLTKPMAAFYERTAKTSSELPKIYANLGHKLEKLLSDIFSCLQSKFTAAYDNELLEKMAPVLKVTFLHKNKQIQSQTAQFWNSTFAKTASLRYPEELKAVLNQVRQKIPIILPGFEAVEMADSLSGPLSDTCDDSQLDIKISGVELKSTGKRESLLTKAEEIKEKSASHSKAVSVKLDFGSMKSPRKNLLLDEEKSVDFVFIPPEQKKRTLTEHQKEVLRTKRVDIPAMYNNLDASQDTTLFTQYTQSQEGAAAATLSEDSVEKNRNEASEDPEDTSEEVKQKAAGGDLARPSSANVVCGDEDDRVVSSTAEDPQADVSASGNGECETRKEADVSVEDSSVNVSSSSTSSDVVSGTPQKPASRRQSFITLEKFNLSNSKAPSSARAKTYAQSSPKILKPDSTEPVEADPKETAIPAEKDPQTRGENGPCLGDVHLKPAQENTSQCDKVTEQQSRNREAGDLKADEKSETSDVIEDCIPDTQSQPQEGGPKDEQDRRKESQASAKMELSAESKENTPPEESGEDKGNRESQNLSSQSEPRRSSRQRNKPVRPGERPGERPAESSESQEKEVKVKLKRGPKSKDEKMADRTILSDGEPARDLQGSSLSQEDLGVKSDLSLTKEERVTKSSVTSAPPAPAVNADPSHEADGNKGAPKDRVRYVTRRSSQGLLSSIENSESDSSEPLEDGEKLKRPGRGRKPKKGAKLVADLKTSSDKSKVVSDVSSPVIPPSTGGTSEQDAQKSEEKENSKVDIGSDSKPPGAELSELKDASQTSSVPSAPAACNNKTYSVHRALSEPSKRASQTFTIASDLSAMLDSMAAEPTASEYTSVFLSSAKSTPVHVCTHSRRGRGRKRSRVCNCSLDADVSQQHKVLCGGSASENVTQELKMCHGDKPELSSIGSQFEDSELVEPNAMSTPLHANKEPAFFSTLAYPVSSDDDKKTLTENESSGGDVHQTVVGVSDFSNNVTVQQKTDNEVQGDEGLKTLESVGAQEEFSMGESERQPPLQDLMPPQPQETSPGTEEEDHHLPESVTEDELTQATHLEGLVVKENVSPVDAEPAADTLEPEDPMPGPTMLGSPQQAKAPLGDHMMDHSPSGAKPKGAWSPTASPSTSILKKGLKRSLEDDSPSPLTKTRRVSFANPLYQQELADDIDRRSPVIRPSSNGSPRSKSPIAQSGQQKLITTPTKGFLSRSPRGLQSPGFKSSKKCLISEMSKESKPIATDCVYPALVSCSAPVEAVLPQLTSNMWARGLGQLVRAKNIKTVGDLSALTPSEIKTLPIRSPKLSNVKKALKSYYEQQRKLRGADDLKGFDETEKLTNEPEDEKEQLGSEKLETSKSVGPPSARQAVLAVPTCLTDPHPHLAVVSLPGLVDAEVPDAKPAVDLPSDVEALGTRFASEGLDRYSGGQLLAMHRRLSGMMDAIVTHMQTRLGAATPEGSV
ncbi:telomere-associated protein RIF1 isoform X2 [Polypterus senegalus]|uniref:telomere-associated protein RIF1 isoform X2 n=1 Tax=Polypterus senegalus TaxID=55291 RepID=UPI001964FEF3|nr:telomere-associated protein RIF1 isoform X2 [Polypterus senegalus]